MSDDDSLERAIHSNSEYELSSAIPDVIFYNEMQNEMTALSEAKLKEFSTNKRINSNKINRQSIKEKQTAHFEYLKTITTYSTVSLNDAITVYQLQCPHSKFSNPAIRKHILKYYKSVLDCSKIKNRWHVSKERLEEVDFSLNLKNS